MIHKSVAAAADMKACELGLRWVLESYRIAPPSAVVKVSATATIHFYTNGQNTNGCQQYR